MRYYWSIEQIIFFLAMKEEYSGNLKYCRDAADKFREYIVEGNDIRDRAEDDMSRIYPLLWEACNNPLPDHIEVTFDLDEWISENYTEVNYKGDTYYIENSYIEGV